MWLWAIPIVSTCPDATQAGISHQKGFSISMVVWGVLEELASFKKSELVGISLEAPERSNGLGKLKYNKAPPARSSSPPSVWIQRLVSGMDWTASGTGVWSHGFVWFHQVMTGAMWRSSALACNSISSKGRCMCVSPAYQPSSAGSAIRVNGTKITPYASGVTLNSLWPRVNAGPCSAAIT